MEDLVISFERVFVFSKKKYYKVLMGKLSQQNQIRNNLSTNNGNNIIGSIVKVKRTRKTVPRDSPPQRSSIYRGVTRFNLFSKIIFLHIVNCYNIVVIEIRIYDLLLILISLC